ncbi:hypothetical protein PHJA_002575700 [Phtheirospermum japonicum]|uniref:Uncharacterized protein n=1 Tax=Phtheirospermum japonicum TaxID=374723 RepID=A0A830CUT1_9LAMI|nr:hypothetical protein PHJA_002575700 [Phtheirospermum japonicum]
MLIYKKETSNERSAQAIRDEDMILDRSHITSLSFHPEEKDFTNDNTVQPVVCDQVNEKGDTYGKMFDQLGPIPSIALGSNLSVSLGGELISEEVEEDYLIDIRLPEQEEMKRHELEIEFLDFFSDINEISGEEDSLIEIDISMGSIRT